MTTMTQDPISQEWTNSDELTATAGALGAKLEAFAVAELPPVLTPYIAAAAAELTEQSDVAWRLSGDSAQIALLRIIARVTILAPDASGPHTAALIRQLDRLSRRRS